MEKAMRICIYYFSGTGNTEYVARKLQQGFQERSEFCDVLPLEEITLGRAKFSEGSYDLVGLGFPVHALDAPQIFRDFIELLPFCRQDYFLFKTAGDRFLWGGSSYAIRLKLANRGWKLKHEAFYRMPSNVFTRVNSNKITLRAAQAGEAAKKAVDEILAGEKKLLPSNAVMRLANGFNRFESTGCKHGSGDWFADEKCSKCGLCVVKCPTGNISFQDGGLHFADKCIFCLRCRWNCPASAIHHRKLELFLLKERFTLP